MRGLRASSAKNGGYGIRRISDVFRNLLGPLTPRERLMLGALLIAVVFILFGPTIMATNGDVGSLFQTPAKQCSSDSGWIGQELVSGQPQVQMGEPKTSFNGSNSANWTVEAGDITCLGFEPPKEDVKNAASLGISLAAFEGEYIPSDDQDSEIQLNTAPTSTQHVESRAQITEPNSYLEQENTEQPISNLDGLLEILVSDDRGKSWKSLHKLDLGFVSSLDNHLAIALPGTYAGDIENLAVKVQPIVATENPVTIWLDSVFITYELGPPQELGLNLLDSQGEKIEAEKPLLSPESKIDALISAKNPNNGVVQGAAQKLVDQFNSKERGDVQVQSEIVNKDSGEVVASDKTQAAYNGRDLSSRDSWEFAANMPGTTKPGEYTLTVTVTDENGSVQSIEQDFLWGVLSINSDQTVYKPNQEAAIAMTVLNDRGETICDADVELIIKGPNQSASYKTSDQSIEVSDNCFNYSEDTTPDYATNHFLGGVGEYSLELIAKTEAGEYRIKDTIAVADDSPVYIKRSGPTRVYPPVTYDMVLDVQAERDFSGKVTELVPASFKVSNDSQFAAKYDSVNEKEGLIEITWTVNLKAGETAKLGYAFDVPSISPAFYLLGPAKLTTAQQTVFEEIRQWQIAGDAIGDMAIYYEDSNTATIGTSLSDMTYEQTVTESGIFSINGGRDTVTLGEAGHYFVSYNVGATSTGGSNRSEINALIDLNGTDIAYGRASCYIRRTGGQNSCWLSGGAIIDASLNDTLSIEVQRTDSNSATVDTLQDESSLTILKLDDSWDYARVSETGGGQTFDSTTPATVSLDNEDELDSSTFSRSDGDITLNSSGHYLVTANVKYNNSSATVRRNVETFLALDGTELVGTRTSAYLRGSNNTQDHATSYMGIISASASDVLSMEGVCEGENCGSAGITNTGGQTGISIVKLPDTADYIRVYSNSGGQAVDATNDPIDWTDQQEVDTNSFSHSISTNPSRITVEQDADYLFLSSFYASSTDTSNQSRQYPHWEWATNGTTETYGSFGKFKRAQQGTTTTGSYSSGNSGAYIAEGLVDSDYIELRNTDESTGTDSTHTFQGDKYAVQALRISSLIPSTEADTRQMHYRWRDDTTDLNTTGGWLAAEDTAVSDRDKDSNLRLRISSANIGQSDEDSSRQYELQFADKSGFGSCSVISSWTGVGNSSDEFAMIGTTHIDPDGEATTSSLLSNSESYTRINGEGRDTGDTSGAIGPLSSDEYTELEYSIQVTDQVITGHTYCFRLYDATAGDVLDGYINFPELSISSSTVNVISGLGEAGTFTSATDGGWSTINFTGSYTTPVVVGTTNTQNGQNSLVFEAQNVTGTSAQMRVCESEGATSTGCDTHAAETVGYMVVDAAVVDDHPGIEAGTFVESGQVDTSTTVTNYTESFSSTPLVFASVQTVAGNDPIEVRVTSASLSSFTAGICQQNSTDGCDGSHGNETVGWIAIDQGSFDPGLDTDAGSVGIASSTWTAQSFTTSFSAAPVALVETQTNNGGEEVEIDEARSVTASGMDVRYCEMQSLDTCDSHTTETVGWFAIEAGQFTTDAPIDMDTYRFYDNADAIQPTQPLAAENISASDVEDGDIIRLRVGLQVGADVPADTVGFTLQYAQASDCSAAGSWSDVGDAGSGTIWRGYDNSTPADGAEITSQLLSNTDVDGTYEEENDSVTNPNAISDAERGEWDWVIENNGATDSTDYCFRMVTDSGGVLYYSRYAQLTTSGPPTALYVERATSFSASATSTWTTIDLSGAPHNIPDDVVVEVAVANGDSNGGVTAGVRQVGSSINDRYIELREAEGAGANQGHSFVVMHVQADSNGDIQYYTTNTGDTDFYILGYWEKGTWVEAWDNFNPGADTTWTNIDLSGSPYDVPVNRVVEIVAANGENASENQAGIQMVGGDDTRLLDIAEAEQPTTSYTTWTAFTQADENSQIEVYAEDDSEMEFYFSGYWDVQPGHFTEKAEVITNPTTDNTWQDRDLTAAPFSVPDSAITEIILANGDTNSEDNFGARSNNGTARLYDIMEAEAGGRVPLRIHTPTDEDAIVDVYHQDVSDTPFNFYLSGYWEENIDPDTPANLGQTETDDTVIATGDWINSTSMKFTADLDDTESYEALSLCIEIEPIGTAFDGTPTQCTSEYAYNGTTVNAEITINVGGEGQFHWQASVVDVAADRSFWASYGANSESARDVGIDTTAPTGGIVYDGTTIGIDIDFNNGDLDELASNWGGFDANISGLSGYEYSMGTTPGATDIVGWTSHGTSTSTIESSLNLNTSQPYYTNVRITDNAGNTATVSSDGQFVAPTLSFSTSPPSIDIGDLNAGNNFTGTDTTTLTTSTNAYNGYVIRAVADSQLTSQNGDTIGMFDGGTYAAPDEWLAGDYGYGYTSSDTLVQGVNRFNNTPCLGSNNPPCYAPWSLIGPGDIIADHTSLISGTPVVNEQFTITHRVTAPSTQEAGTYLSTIRYTATATY